MTMGASATSYIPDDVTYQNLNGQQLAIKTYTLLPDQDPSDLYEDDFEYDGFRYSMSDIVKEEQRYQEENAHTEVVTVTTASKNLEDIQCQRETLVTGQRKAELEIEDIEHAAEFYNLDASHGYQLYKLLHDARVRRRKCKNAIAWIDFILEQRPERFVENDPSARIVGTRSRDYAPRALPALFEWENEGQTPTANL